MQQQQMRLNVAPDGAVTGVVVGSPADVGVGGGGGAPVEQPGGVKPWPQGTITGNGTRFNSDGEVLAQGVYYAFGGSGKRNISFAIDSGGYPCYHGFDLNAMQRDGTGGTNWIKTPEGDWTYYVMYTADPGRVQGGHIDMLPA